VYVAGFERGVRPIGLWSTVMILSKCSWPSSVAKGAGCVDQRALARAGHPRHAHQQAHRQLEVHRLQVVAACAGQPQPVQPRLRARARHRDLPALRQVGTGQ